jgi:DNA-binding beta-propeller fold protein YncE
MLIFLGVLSLSLRAQTVPPLELTRTISLPGVEGRFDHFAIDTATDTLFAAATGNHSVEVVDLKNGRVRQSLTGLGKPHGLVWVASTGSLYVSDGQLAELRVYKGSPLTLAGTLRLSDDADDMVYNDSTHLLYVGHGGSDAANPAGIAVVDATNLRLIADLPVASHPEALDLDESRQRIFANIADTNEVAVIDARTSTVAATWKLTKAGDNVSLAYHSDDQILFVACRKPGTLIALDAATGEELMSLPTGSGADDLFNDATLHRVYVISGAGEVDVYQVDPNRKMQALDVIHTAPGAKTALFVPSQRALYVGVPGTGGRPAEVRVYSAADR